MQPEKAEQLLIDWALVTRDRDDRVRAAIAGGLSKYRVNQLTGIGPIYDRPDPGRVCARKAQRWPSKRPR